MAQPSSSIKGGTTHELTATRRVGVSSDERLPLEATVTGSIGIRGHAELGAQIGGQLQRAYRIEEATERSQKYTWQAPKCGHLRIQLFQKISLVRLRYYDSRWLHGDEWRQSFRDWLEDLDDRTTRSENDPACGCEPRYVIGADGLMDIDMGRVKLRDTYRIQEPRQVHLDTLNLSFNIDSETWPYYVELDVPRDHIPPYLLFLAAEESPVLRAACSPIEKPGFDGRLRDEPVEFWTPGTELEVAY